MTYPIIERQNNSLLNQYEEMFYRGRFGELTASAANVIKMADPRTIPYVSQCDAQKSKEDFELRLLVSAAYHELHHLQDAVQALGGPALDSPLTPQADHAEHVANKLSRDLSKESSIQFSDPPPHEGAQQRNFLKAQRLYLLGRRKEALAKFTEISQQAGSENLRFNAFLRVADICYELKVHSGLVLVMSDLQKYDRIIALSGRLRLMLLFGKANLMLYQSSGLAKRSFQAVLSFSMREGWDYFTLRALYGLATVADHEEKIEELHTYLSLLKCLLEDNEHVHMTYLVNHRFKHILTIDTFLELDPSRYRIFVHDRWVDFSEYQEVFQLLLVLKNAGKPLSAAQLRDHLGPHDEATLGTLSQMARKLIERDEEKPCIFLGNNDGFHLAVK